jgi:hypothetical protein
MHDMNISGIGRRIEEEVLGGTAAGERILSGYWTAGDEAEQA